MTAERLFRLHVRMELQPGKDADFENGWLALAAVAQSHPANLNQWLARSAQETSVYLVVSDWTDEDGYRDFLASPGFKQHIRPLRACMANDVMHTSHVVHHLPGAGHPPREGPTP